MTVARVRQFLVSLSPVEQTNHLIALLEHDAHFRSLALAADLELQDRDAADDQALSLGIADAQARGLLAAGVREPQWPQIAVDRLSPCDISRAILERFLEPGRTPRLLAVAGPSGIGKGTVTAQLAKDMPAFSTWSNGDVFRFVTYLVLFRFRAPADYSGELSEAAVGRAADAVRLDATGSLVASIGAETVRFADLADRDLRSVSVSRLVPRIARFSQGQVIALTNAASRRQPPGSGLLVEGRKMTLNHVDADVRIELVVADRTELGARRVAQRMVALLSSESPESGESLESLLRRAYR